MNPYIPLLLLFAFAATIAGGLLILSHLLSPKRRTSPEKALPYECGIDPVGSTRERFSIKFYLVAMLFILFDVEVVFLYPWAILFKEFANAGWGLFLFIEMAVFLGILVVGLIYIYGRRAIEWE
jgi:NADH-quinone oxidoreductase subunit A